MSRPTHEEEVDAVMYGNANNLSAIREALEGIFHVLVRIADKVAPEKQNRRQKMSDKDAEGQEIPPFAVYENFSPESREYTVIAREVLAEITRIISGKQRNHSGKLTDYEFAIHGAASFMLKAKTLKDGNV